jgi:site-specific recombinase XerD
MGLDKMLDCLEEKSGVTGVRVSAHTFRHTYACRFLSRPGADIWKLKELLGHTDIATTQVYLRAFDQGLARRGLTSIADSILK